MSKKYSCIEVGTTGETVTEKYVPLDAVDKTAIKVRYYTNYNLNGRILNIWKTGK
ncbi:hypothetical protein [Dyadobacter luteus]|nr:hypothetical protein [Dyadobacter luteus]